MHSLRLLAEALPASGWQPEALPEEPADGVCCLTGAAGPSIARKHLLGPSFTDLDLLARPDSDRIGIDAWTAFTAGELRDGKKRRYSPERMSSWICIGREFRCLSRQSVRDAVLSEPPAEPWCGYATTSYKKHGALRAPVNGPGQGVWLWETRLVDCTDRELVADTWQCLRRYQDAGIPRPVLETGEVEPHLVRKIGIATALDYQRWSSPLIGTTLYQFLVYLLPSVEELKEMRPGPQEGPQEARNAGGNYQLL